MITSPSKLIDVDELKLVRVAPAQPDAVGIIAYLNDTTEVFELAKMSDGKCTLQFFGFENVHFEPIKFIELIENCMTELESWATELRKAGSAWCKD